MEVHSSFVHSFFRSIHTFVFRKKKNKQVKKTWDSVGFGDEWFDCVYNGIEFAVATELEVIQFAFEYRLLVDDHLHVVPIGRLAQLGNRMTFRLQVFFQFEHIMQQLTVLSWLVILDCIHKLISLDHILD